MDIFEQKIQSLTQKLTTITPRPQSNQLSSQQLLNSLTTINSQSQLTLQQLQYRYTYIIKQLNTYQHQLTKIQQINIQNLSIIKSDYQVSLDNLYQLIKQHQQQNQKCFYHIKYDLQENCHHQQSEFQYQVKCIKKSIQKQMDTFIQLLSTIEENPQKIISKIQNKLYKQYYIKLLKIQQNQKKKAQKISSMQKNVQKRILKLYQNISQKINKRQKQIKTKFDKIKKIFSIVAQI